MRRIITDADLKWLEELKPSGINHPGPFIDWNKTSQECLEQMLSTSPDIYEKCLDTIGFAYGFNQLANRAIRFDQTFQLVSQLISRLRSAEDALRIIEKEYPTIIVSELARAHFDKVRNAEKGEG